MKKQPITPRSITTSEPQFGGSFSAKYCRELGVSPRDVLTAITGDLGVRRLRLMSYWDEHEQQPGVYDFTELDWQMDMAAACGAKVSLCLGKRQPRWPECHMPAWAQALEKKDWYAALFAYIEVVVLRYRDHPALESWQLENEAMLRSFGVCQDGDYSHARLKAELAIVKRLDTMHPVIMTLSDNWGFPWRGPWPDIFGFSVYVIVMNAKGNYVGTAFAWWWHRWHARLITLITRRPVLLHELQAEPWGDRPLLQMSPEQQARSMSATQLRNNVQLAQRIGQPPTYLWGLEWWYERRLAGDDSLWREGKRIYQ